MITSLKSNNNLNYKTELNILEKALFENVSRLNEFSLGEQKRLYLDDHQLKKLNSIFSNLPFHIVKQDYEKYSYEVYLVNQTTTNLKNTQRQKSSSKKKNKSRRKKKPSENETNNTIKRLSSSNSTTTTTSSSSSSGRSTSINNGTSIVIHVSDEVKRLKQDFSCPRDLLIAEMGYFSSNLYPSASSKSQESTVLARKSLDEIDISVHCDINIFDWLMRYVKRSCPNLIEKNITTPSSSFSETTNKIVYSSDGSVKYVEPLLDVNNAVSILLSSDFLGIYIQLKSKVYINWFFPFFSFQKS